MSEISQIDQLVSALRGALGDNATYTIENAAYFDAWHHVMFGGIGIALLLAVFFMCRLWRIKGLNESMKGVLVIWCVCFTFFMSHALSPLHWKVIGERQIGVAHGIFVQD